MTTETREPIISVLGHVDHGKTTLLDWIRGSVVASREAGGITQHIGATDVPFEVVQEICGELLKKLKLKIQLRGLLFIDTPGHEAFTTLRKRGGSVADLAILVVDINDGLMPQTLEAIEILKQYKTPFIVAANKIDMIRGWVQNEAPQKQPEDVRAEFYNKFYTIVGKLSEKGFESDLYSQVSDFTKQVAIVPISAKTGEGIPELLMVLMGLAQQYLAKKLTVGVDTPAKGTILEVKEERGLGTTIDVIIYEGTIHKNDTIVVGARGEPVVTKVKALLRPHALDEMRDPEQKFKSVNSVYAASGVKIAAPGLENAIAGAPVYVGDAKIAEDVKKEIEGIEFSKDINGVVVKTDTLGSLEAFVKMLTKEGIAIRKGGIGKVHKLDVIDASTVKAHNKYLGVILAFNTSALDDAKTHASDSGVPIISNKVIYRLIEDYRQWIKDEREKEKIISEKTAIAPGKFRILPKHVFRESKPAIVGVEVLGGTLTLGARILKTNGRVVGRIKTMQLNKEDIKSAKAGEKVAISIEDVTIGRQLDENEIVYTFISLDEIKEIKTEELNESELNVLREIRDIQKNK